MKRPRAKRVHDSKQESAQRTQHAEGRHNQRESLSVTKCILWLALAATLLTVAVWIVPSPADPVAFRYSEQEFPKFTGPLAINNHLKKAKRLFENEMVGPESFVVDNKGQIYTGLADGRLICISPDLQSFTTVVRTGDPTDAGTCGSEEFEQHCGRILGMQFNPLNLNELYAVDSSFGLLKINIKTGLINILVPTEGANGDGAYCNLINDLVVLENGSVFFTDSSKKFKRWQNRMEVVESRPNGELLHFNPSDGSTSIAAKGLHFPNGICISRDQQSLLITESTRARIVRYYLSGPKAGSVDVFVDNLPGLPDNITPSTSGGYWIAFAVTRHSKLIDKLAGMPMIRTIIAKLRMIPLIEAMLPKHGLVVELDHSGQVVRSLHDQGGSITASVSHVLDLGDRLIIGSYYAPYIVVLKYSDIE